jgi:hypothetical protein
MKVILGVKAEKSKYVALPESRTRAKPLRLPKESLKKGAK